MDAPVLPFEELDALLEEAYALEGSERAEFVARLPDREREQVQQLLEISNALTLERISSEVRGAFEEVSLRLPTAGPWRLHEELGSGGMGQVFLASRVLPDGHRDDIQRAAVKVLWSVRAHDEVRARFLRERRLLASLNHPGLARFVDAGFLSDGRPWFAMEYVAGRAIDEHARGLPLQARLQLFVEVCASVAHAHQRLIVHRDIKPQNVLVDETGRARLLDFGIAGVLEDIDDGVHTQTSGAPLTIQYASPEQLRGGVITAASDIYQLGLLLYELLTGRRPYDLSGTSLMEALDVVNERTPVKPSAHASEVSADLDAIVMTALAKEPDRRYRSVNELAEDIRRLEQGLPVRAVPPTPWYLAQRFLRRNLVLVLVAALSALGLATATVVSVSMANEATAQAARSQAAQQILSDVFRKADPFRENGAAVTLKEALTRARPEIEARLGDDALLAFEVNHTLADIYQSLGLIDEEQTAFRAMLEAADRLSEDPVDARHLTAIAGMGSVLARTNPVEAVIYFDARLPAQPGSAEAVGAWLSAQYSYVGALSRVREFGRADAGTLSMAEIVERFGIDNPRTQGRLSQLRAEMARRAGDTEAEASHRKDTVEYMRTADNPSALAVILSNYAIYLGRSGRYDASEAAFKEALAIFEEANLRDPTYATVLRSYAGLLFRTNRVDEAIAAAEKSLSLLAPSSLLYARFVGELNLARYHFVAGNLEATLSGMLRALPPAFEGFRGDPAVPRRMLPLFAKALVFGGAPEVAQVALNTGDRECEGRPQWRYALEAVEDRRDAAGREKVTAAVRALEVKSRAGHLSQGELDGFAHVFASELPPFFDAQDRWEALEALRALTTGALTLPPGLEAAWTKLHVERRAAAALVSDRRAEFRRWAEAFAASGPTLGGGGPDCPD